MATFTREFSRLFNGEILSKEERRALSITVIARVMIMGAALTLLYGSLPVHQDGISVQVLAGASVAMFAGHLAITFTRLNNNVRATLLLVGIFIAGVASEPQPSAVFFGRSSLFLALPAVIAPAIMEPGVTFAYWLFVQVMAVVVSITGSHPFNFFNSVMLLSVSIASWLVSARADMVIDILTEQKRVVEEARDEAETAIGIIVTAEEARLEFPPWPKTQERHETVDSRT